MGKVVIHLVGTLREQLNGAAFEVEIDDGILFGRLLELLSLKTGRDVPSIFCRPETGEILPALAIFINQQNIRQQRGLETPVQAGDEIIIMRADMAGG